MSDKSLKMPSIARGGQPPMGAPTGLLEMDVGPGKRYDPDRDVLVFWKYMVAAVSETLKTRRVPALEELDGNPGLERRVVASCRSLISAMAVKVSSYDEMARIWLNTVDDPEAADLIMKIFGRAIMQFYVECALTRGVQEEQVWPLGMDKVIEDIMASPNWVRNRPGFFIRLKRLFVAVIDVLRFW